MSLLGFSSDPLRLFCCRQLCQKVCVQETESSTWGPSLQLNLIFDLSRVYHEFSAWAGSNGFFLKAKQIVRWSLRECNGKWMNSNKQTNKQKNRSATIRRLTDSSTLWSPSTVTIRFSYLGAIIYFYSNLKAAIRNRRHPKRNAVPGVWLWKKSCISGWSGRLHATAANQTQVDELSPSCICLPANLLFTLFLSSMSVFFYSNFLLAIIPHPRRNSFLPLLCCLWKSRLQCKGSHRGT